MEGSDVARPRVSSIVCRRSVAVRGVDRVGGVGVGAVSLMLRLEWVLANVAAIAALSASSSIA